MQSNGTLVIGMPNFERGVGNAVRSPLIWHVTGRSIQTVMIIEWP